jgi:hypothetical protein
MTRNEGELLRSIDEFSHQAVDQQQAEILGDRL